MGIFDDITLPDDQKDKPVDVSTLDDEGEKKEEASRVDDDSKKDDTSTSGDDKKVEEEKKDEEKTDDKASSDKNDDKSIPFHEHPDWIKQQDKLREKELELARAQGQLEVYEKKGIQADDSEKKEDAKTASEVAKQKIKEKVKNGWKPSDQLELNAEFAKEFEAELDRRDAEKAKKQTEENSKLEEKRKEIQKEVDSIYADSGIISDSDKKKAEDLCFEWSKKGIPISTQSLRIAVDNLKASGQIGKKQEEKKDGETNTDVNEEKNDAADEKSKKLSANAKIKRAGQGGTEREGENKKSYKSMHNRTLDDIVQSHSDALG